MEVLHNPPKQRLKDYLDPEEGSFSIKYNKTLKLKILNQRRSETKSKLFSINCSLDNHHDQSFDPFSDPQQTYNDLVFDLEAVRHWMQNFKTIDFQLLKIFNQLPYKEQDELLQQQFDRKDDNQYASKILNDIISLTVKLLEKCESQDTLHDLQQEAIITQEDLSKICLSVMEAEVLLMSSFEDRNKTDYTKNLIRCNSSQVLGDCIITPVSTYDNINKHLPSSSLGSSLQTLRNNGMSSTARSSLSPQSDKKNSGCYMQESGSFHNLSKQYKNKQMYRSFSLNCDLDRSHSFSKKNMHYSRFSDGTYSTFQLHKGYQNSDSTSNHESEIHHGSNLQDKMRMEEINHRNSDLRNHYRLNYYDELSADADRSDCSSMRIKKSRRRPSYFDRLNGTLTAPRSSITRRMMTPRKRLNSAAKYATYNQYLECQGDVGCDSSDFSISSHDGMAHGAKFTELAEKMDRHLQMKSLARARGKCQKFVKSGDSLSHQGQEEENCDSLNISEPSSYYYNDENSLANEEFEDDDGGEIYDPQDVQIIQKNIEQIRQNSSRRLRPPRSVRSLMVVDNADSSAPGMFWDNDQYQIYTNSTEQDLSGSCQKLLSQLEDYSWDDRLSDLSLRDASFDTNNNPNKLKHVTSTPVRNSTRSSLGKSDRSKSTRSLNGPCSAELDTTVIQLNDSRDVFKVDSGTMTENVIEEKAMEYSLALTKRPKSISNLIGKSSTQTTSGYTSDLDSPPRSFSHSSSVAEDGRLPLNTSVPHRGRERMVQTQITMNADLKQDLLPTDAIQTDSAISEEIQIFFSFWAEMNSKVNRELTQTRENNMDIQETLNRCKNWLENCDLSKRRLNQILSTSIKRIDSGEEWAVSLKHRSLVYANLKESNSLLDHYDLLCRKIYIFISPFLDKRIDNHQTVAPSQQVLFLFFFLLSLMVTFVWMYLPMCPRSYLPSLISLRIPRMKDGNLFPVPQ